ncbi:MAG: hypothetical protein NZ959_05205 [Armatimonadetes bacterium]|nr:hypothetical protein [Armatimonadota bacterium]
MEEPTLQTKTAVVEYQIGLTDLTHLAQVVSKVPPMHGEPYTAGIVLKIKGLTNENQELVVQGLKRVKGVVDARADVRQGIAIVHLQTQWEEGKDRPSVSLDRLIGAVEGASGLTVEP